MPSVRRGIELMLTAFSGTLSNSFSSWLRCARQICSAVTLRFLLSSRRFCAAWVDQHGHVTRTLNEPVWPAQSSFSPVRKPRFDSRPRRFRSNGELSSFPDPDTPAAAATSSAASSAFSVSMMSPGKMSH